MSAVVIDIETTTKTHLGRKASPFTDDNWIVAMGWQSSGMARPDGSYYGNDRSGGAGMLDVLIEPDVEYIVGFNIKFDLLHLLRGTANYEAWQNFVARGGLVWDCQLAEYLLAGQVQEAHMLSLDEVAPKYGGNVKISEVKAYWQQGVNTPDIPRQLLMDYLLGRGDDEGDIGNTRKVFGGQLLRAEKSGQLQSIRLNMGALLASIEMERNGLHVDTGVAQHYQDKLGQEEIALSMALQGYLPEDLPFPFNWASRHHKSALIFGGSLKYQARVPVLDEQGRPTYAQREEVQDTGEVFKSGKNAGQPKTRKVKVDDLTRPKSRMEDFYFTFPGFTKPRREWTNEDGTFSTGSDVIEELAATTDVPFLKALGRLTAVTKDLGTYYRRTTYGDDGQVKEDKGMLTLVGDDGLVHHSINHTSTVTGRLSSSNPNMQNLPRGDTSDVKRMFTSRFGADGAIISSDFSALEIYCQAWLSRDRQLIADLRAGLDMHCARLATAEGLQYEDVFRKCKVEKLPDWDLKRTHIKVFSFQRAYGAGAKKIAAYLKLPEETIERFIEADEERYPSIPRWQAAVEQAVKGSRVPTAKWVQHPVLRKPVQIGRGSYFTLDGKRYVFQELPSPEWQANRRVETGFMPTELKNYPVQGLGGEVMKAAMWLTVRALYRYKNFGGQALLVNTVHDAQYIDAAGPVARKAAALLHACMEAASDLFEYHFKVPIPVPVPSETGMGQSMFDENDPGVSKEKLAEIRTAIRNWFMGGFTPSYMKGSQ